MQKFAYDPDRAEQLVRAHEVSDRADEAPLQSRRLAGPAGAIMQAARYLFETRGVSRTTITLIAGEANLTRELVYYYFTGKRQIIQAVLDDYVEDMVETALVWNESRSFGQTEENLRSAIQAFRRALYDASGAPRPMIRVLEELGCRDAFDVRAVRETVDALSACVVHEYARFHEVRIEMVHEMFCVVIFGLVGLIKLNPSIGDDALMKVVEQTLHLDMEPIAE